MNAAATIVAAAACTWNSPGLDPYRGKAEQNVAQAAQRYGFDRQTTVALVEKVRLLHPDATLTITRDAIYSADGAASNLREMHYGKGRVCAGPVLRDGWKPGAAQTALLYCARGECVAIPMVCGNVSRIDWVPRQRGPEPVVKAWVPGGPAVVHSVPEPGSLALAAVGLALCVATSRCK